LYLQFHSPHFNSFLENLVKVPEPGDGMLEQGKASFSLRFFIFGRWLLWGIFSTACRQSTNNSVFNMIWKTHDISREDAKPDLFDHAWQGNAWSYIDDKVGLHRIPSR
jgi:hypothetical protein